MKKPRSRADEPGADGGRRHHRRRGRRAALRRHGCPPGQADIPRAADGATWLLEQLFGRERGVPTRTTVGVTALADHFPVELEVLVELYK